MLEVLLKHQQTERTKKMKKTKKTKKMKKMKKMKRKKTKKMEDCQKVVLLLVLGGDWKGRFGVLRR